jgi:hypothetical protein
MQQIFMLYDALSPVPMKLTYRQQRANRNHLPHWNCNHIPASRWVLPRFYCERCSLQREVRWEGHARLKFVLTNR